MVGVSKSTSRMAQPAGAPDRRFGSPSGRVASRAWAGRGSGERCDLCQGIIDEDQIEYEIEPSEAGSRVVTLHLGCYEQWVLGGESLED